jgi:hypothetical protein
MQCFDNGAFYTVTVTAREVQNFRQSWPCSNLRNRPVTFQFDKRNGDLVDSNDSEKHPDADGGAVLALCDDAKQYGASRLKIAF